MLSQHLIGVSILIVSRAVQRRLGQLTSMRFRETFLAVGPLFQLQRVLSKSLAAAAIPILVFSSLSAAPPVSPGYLWPMAREPVLTSSFGEYRSGHIHSGIDLSTGGRAGEPVRAVAAGRVVRLSVSPWGYGRAIYLQLDDGRIAVYAHLERFCAALDRIVYSEQKRSGRYRINLLLDENPLYAKKPIRFARGDILGYSGESGAGFPHLHFEIRDRVHQYPLNPLRYGFPVSDSRPPMIGDILIRPIDPSSTVNAADQVATWRSARSAAGTSALADTPWVSGTIGLAIDGSDQADLNYSLADYARALWINDSLVFRAHYDTLPYEISRQILLDRDNKGSPWDKASFEKLYREFGSKLPIYGRFGEGDGLIRAAQRKPGLHRIRVELEDASGNRTCTEGVLGLGQPPALNLFRAFRDSTGDAVQARIERGSFPLQWLRIEGSSDTRTWKILAAHRVRFPDSTFSIRLPRLPKGMELLRGSIVDSLGQAGQPLYCALADPGKEPPISGLDLTWRGETAQIQVLAAPQSSREPRLILRFADTSGAISIPLRRTAPETWTGQADLSLRDLNSGQVLAFFPDDSVRKTHMIRPYRIRPESGGYLSSFDSLAGLEFPNNCVIRPLIAELRQRNDLSGDPSSGLAHRSKAYSANPSWFYTDRRFEMEITLDDTTHLARTAIYQWTGRDWGHCDSRYDAKSRRLRAQASGLRPFAIMTDTVAPVIRDLSITDNQSLFSSPIDIHFRIVEKGSGIGSDLQIKTWIDSEIWINEYDPERSRVGIGRTRELMPGPHVLRIIVVDAAGNSSTRTVAFRIGRN